MHSKIYFESSYPPLSMFRWNDESDIGSDFLNLLSQQNPFLLYISVKRGNYMSGFPIIAAKYNWTNDFAGLKL